VPGPRGPVRESVANPSQTFANLSRICAKRVENFANLLRIFREYARILLQTMQYPRHNSFTSPVDGGRETDTRHASSPRILVCGVMYALSTPHLPQSSCLSSVSGFSFFSFLTSTANPTARAAEAQRVADHGRNPWVTGLAPLRRPGRGGYSPSFDFFELRFCRRTVHTACEGAGDARRSP
jgi:hypothetical protein